LQFLSGKREADGPFLLNEGEKRGDSSGKRKISRIIFYEKEEVFLSQLKREGSERCGSSAKGQQRPPVFFWRRGEKGEKKLSSSAKLSSLMGGLSEKRG